MTHCGWGAVEDFKAAGRGFVLKKLSENPWTRCLRGPSYFKHFLILNGVCVGGGGE